MRCSHCDTLITDTSTNVTRGDKTFCCNNCATAFVRAQESPDEVPAASGNGRTGSTPLPTSAPLTR